MAAAGRRRPAERGGKRRKAPRRRPPPYLLQETDDDVLLVISALPGEESPPRRRPRKGAGGGGRGGGRGRPPRAALVGGQSGRGPPPPPPPPVVPTGASGAGWGESLPLELLARIFRQGLAVEGPSVRFLGRVAQVCRLWNAAAANPLLWQEVSISNCWGPPPGQKRASPALEKRILGTVEWLVANRFSHLRDFTLFHWKSHVPFVLKALAASCPLLGSLKLSHCAGVTTEALCMLAAGCPQLESLNLQNSQVDASALVGFVEAAGPRIRHLWLTYLTRMNTVLGALLSGVCPGLQLLEINTEIKQSAPHFQLPIEQLQAACPQLRVLRLLNVTCSPKPVPRSAPDSPGFLELEELCLATTAFSFVDDAMLMRILHASRQLRILDLRGCFRITPKGLEGLPCPDVEQLYLGLYGSASHLQLPLKGSALITWKWSHSLRELDLTGQSFVESDLEQAMAAFTGGEGVGRDPLLRSLNLTGTKITLHTISALIARCPALTYLNLTSCRHLPRGMKKAYRGDGEIRQCLHLLLTSLEGPEGPRDAT